MIQPPELSKIALPDNIGIIYDATQTLGLIAGEVLSNPLETQENMIMIGVTHKTFPGVTCGYIATNHHEYIEKITQNISPNYLRNVQVNNITSVCLSMIELLRFGEEYAQNIIRTANDLGQALESKGIGVKRVSTDQFTYTHQLFIETESARVDEAYRNFRKYGITLNKRNTAYAVGFRLGVQEVARYHFDNHIDELAELIRMVLHEPEQEKRILSLKAELSKLKTDRYIMDDIFMEWD